MNNDLRAVFQQYQREQSQGGYTFVPGDEHIFRDAWNLAIEAAISRIVPSQSGRGLPDFYIREIRLLKSPASDVESGEHQHG